MNADQGTNIFRRLAAGLLIFAVLLLANVPTASAHAYDHNEQDRLLVASDHQRSETPTRGHGCDGCLACCAKGQCSMANVALFFNPYPGLKLKLQTATYGGCIARTAANLGVGPAIPPPRLDA